MLENITILNPQRSIVESYVSGNKRRPTKDTVDSLGGGHFDIFK